MKVKLEPMKQKVYFTIGTDRFGGILKHRIFYLKEIVLVKSYVIPYPRIELNSFNITKVVDRERMMLSSGVQQLEIEGIEYAYKLRK